MARARWLAKPGFLLAVAVLALNDHVLKAQFVQNKAKTGEDKPAEEKKPEETKEEDAGDEAEG